MSDKNTTTDAPIASLLARRFSPRAFDPDRPVDRPTVLCLLEAARWAPSCYNEQPWRYLIFDRFDSVDDWTKALRCLVEGNRAWAAQAPVLLAAIASTRFSHDGSDNRWCEYDTGAASENLCLQATSIGLAAHQMGGFDADAVVTAFDVPEGHRPMAMIAVGHPGDPSVLSEPAREKEAAPRSRRAVGEWAFLNQWNNSLTNTS